MRRIESVPFMFFSIRHRLRRPRTSSALICPSLGVRYPYNNAPCKMFAKRTNWNLEPNRLSVALAAHRAAGKPLVDLTVSNPTECGFQYDAQSLSSALNNPAALHYEPNPRGLE